MYTEQGIQHILALLQYGHSLDDLMGQLIQGSLKTLILELGIPENPFMQDYNVLHLLTTNSWIKAVWQFQNQYQIQIETDLLTLSISQVNDRFLIWSFKQAGIKGTKLAKINWCRIYLKVTLANICDGTGMYILPDMWAGQPNQTFTSGYQWPNQDH